MDIISYGLADEAIKKSAQAETAASSAQTAANDALARSLNIKQVTKLGISGTSSSPHVTDITLANTTIEYIKPSPSVLRIVSDMGTTGGTENVIKVASSFTNAEASDFNQADNPNVMFDGIMSLRTSHAHNMAEDTSYQDSGALYTTGIDRTRLTQIKRIEIGV